MVSIIRGMKLPDSNGGGGKRKYPWDDMKIGDAVKVPDGSNGYTAKAEDCCARNGFMGRKFTQRRTKQGTFIFRTK